MCAPPPGRKRYLALAVVDPPRCPLAICHACGGCSDQSAMRAHGVCPQGLPVGGCVGGAQLVQRIRKVLKNSGWCSSSSTHSAFCGFSHTTSTVASSLVGGGAATASSAASRTSPHTAATSSGSNTVGGPSPPPESATSAMSSAGPGGASGQSAGRAASAAATAWRRDGAGRRQRGSKPCCACRAAAASAVAAPRRRGRPREDMCTATAAAPVTSGAHVFIFPCTHGGQVLLSFWDHSSNQACPDIATAKVGRGMPVGAGSDGI